MTPGSPAPQEPSGSESERPGALGTPTALVQPLGVEIDVQPNETLIEAAWRCGYYWPTVCYGQAECTACVVAVVAGAGCLHAVADDEAAALRTLPARRLPDGAVRRLACRLQFRGRITVEKRGVLRPGVA
jgi:2Fe-2S ferredoxin